MTRRCSRLRELGVVATVVFQLGVGLGRAGGVVSAAPAFSAPSCTEGGFDRRSLGAGWAGLGGAGGGSLVIARITDRSARRGGGALRERGRRENGNASGPKPRDRDRRSCLLSACARTFAEDGGDNTAQERLARWQARRASGEPAGSAPAGGVSRIGAGREQDRGIPGAGHKSSSSGAVSGEARGGASHGRSDTVANSGRVVSASAGDNAERNRISGGSDSASSEQQIRVLVWMLEDEESTVERRNIIITLRHVSPSNHPLVIDALCRRLVNFKREAIPTRIAVLRALEQLAARGNAAVVDALLTCVEKDNSFDVRQPAMALLASVALPGDERVMELALQQLRKKDLRGEPLFKPGDDPIRLTKEAIQVLVNIAPRGSQEAWSLLLRRVVDDNMLGVRIAAIEALASIADPDMLADGGARGTVQAFALAMLDEQHPDSQRLNKAGHAAFRALMHPGAGGVYWG